MKTSSTIPKTKMSLPSRIRPEPTLPAVLGLIEEQRGSVYWERAEDGRWFIAEFAVDFFDGPHLALRWGGQSRRASGRKRLWLEENTDKLARELNRICKRRRKHGYVLQ